MARECSTHEREEKYVEFSSKNLMAWWEDITWKDEGIDGRIILSINLELSLCVIKHYAMKTCGGWWIYRSTIIDLSTSWR
jgi:hypothetical protein